MKPISIAIDGPSAAGKSTIARRIASALGFVYVDTGAMYRAIGCYGLQKGADLKDAAAVAALLPEINLAIRYENGEQHIYLNDEDVSEKIRLPEMSMAASDVSAVGEVRAFLLDRQRAFAASQSVVMDGRDIGTVVLPDADVKFFLTASAEERARRRMRDYEQKGQSVDFARLLEETILRDKQDSERAIAPLRQAPDAIKIDSTSLTLEETIDAMLSVVREKTKGEA
jgi:cytidylate kinase